MRAATLGVCPGVWGCSVWDPGRDRVSGSDGLAAACQVAWDARA